MKKIVVPAVLALTMLAQPVYAQSNAEGVRSEVAVESNQVERVNENGELIAERAIVKDIVKWTLKKGGEIYDKAKQLKDSKFREGFGAGFGAAEMMENREELTDFLANSMDKAHNAYVKHIKNEQTKDEKIHELEERIKKQEEKEERRSGCRQCGR